ncbi:MAG: hypothetical protein ABI723_19105 [Bacteroidia bacterium]
MKKAVWLILFCLLFIFDGHSEDTGVLTVFYFRGKIEFTKGNDSPVVLKNTGEKFNNNCLLKLYPGSYLLIYANDGKNLTLNSPGIYKADSLIKELIKQEETLANVFFKYLITEFKTFHKDEKKYAEQYMKEMGGVSRGIGVSMILPVNNEIINGNAVFFIWNKDNRKEYEFILNKDSLEYKALLQIVSRDTSMKILKKSEVFSENKKYYWTIRTINDGPNIFYSFRFADPDYSEKVKNDLEGIKNFKEGSDELKYLLRGICYEKYLMFSEANREFVEAMIKFPESKELQNAYGLFLVRIGQKNLAEKCLK